MDKYLWAVRVFKTRSDAADAIRTNKVTVNGSFAKPSREVKIGDLIAVRKRQVTYSYKVLGLAVGGRSDGRYADSGHQTVSAACGQPCGGTWQLYGKNEEYFIPVEIPDELLEKIPADRREALKKVLEQDPRPSYQNSEERVYGTFLCGNGNQIPGKGPGAACRGGRARRNVNRQEKQGDIQEKWRRRKQKYVISKYDTVPVCQ